MINKKLDEYYQLGREVGLSFPDPCIGNYHNTMLKRNKPTLRDLENLLNGTTPIAEELKSLLDDGEQTTK